MAAARAVALANSVACEDAVVVAAGSNVLVHLKPAPVVARVMTGTAVLHGDVERWLAREVAVGAFLGERGLAVPPSDVLAPGPHQHGGLWMTFWEFVEHDASRPLPRPHELGGSLRELHTALADFPGELGRLSDVRDWLDLLLAGLHPTRALTARDRDQLRSRLRELTPSVFESSLPAQAIHGDASISNLLRTQTGLIWNDLEDICIGPVHWDVAGLIAEARARGASEAFVAGFLRGYGRRDVEELDEFIAAHLLYTTVWQAFDAQRRSQPRTNA
ncbi:MAG TPA: aminoglycoside phosphotransferase family protein [Solirubrobacteraceae bacterium]|nr:aminoglycoside phosphotransferase family protein [Solirubrobacteraceae bacterium]